MKLSNALADIVVPDGIPLEDALRRTTHLGVGAHQDDLEFFAVHGILACYERPDRWFTGITVTDGGGSARSGAFANLSDFEMKKIRCEEQRKAAAIGQYAAMVQLGLSSGEVKRPSCSALVSDLRCLFETARPDVLYLHNPADRHDTHVAVLAHSIEAVRQLRPEIRPSRVYGCEVWRDLDWVPEHRKTVLPVSGHADLQSELNAVFESQISGGKRYDLAVMGRRLAHATFHDSHSVDRETGLTFAIDLGPLCRDDAPSVVEFMDDLIDEFASDVRSRIAKYILPKA